MKKKILGLFMAVCLSVTLAGCDASIDDVEKQAKKMETVIENGDIFEGDWAITNKIVQLGERSEVLMKKDGEHYYAKIGNEEIWYIKEGGEYKEYNGTTKEYKTLSIMEFNEKVDFDLKSLYGEWLEEVKSMPEQCKKEENTCEFEKTLFGTLTVKIDGELTDSSFVIRNGKFLEVKMSVTFLGSVDYEIEYKNQTIELPDDVSDYKEAGI